MSSLITSTNSSSLNPAWVYQPRSKLFENTARACDQFANTLTHAVQTKHSFPAFLSLTVENEENGRTSNIVVIQKKQEELPSKIFRELFCSNSKSTVLEIQQDSQESHKLHFRNPKNNKDLRYEAKNIKEPKIDTPVGIDSFFKTEFGVE